jgi:hypothetical protein
MVTIVLTSSRKNFTPDRIGEAPGTMKDFRDSVFLRQFWASDMTENAAPRRQHRIIGSWCPDMSVAMITEG